MDKDRLFSLLTSNFEFWKASGLFLWKQFWNWNRFLVCGSFFWIDLNFVSIAWKRSDWWHREASTWCDISAHYLRFQNSYWTVGLSLAGLFSQVQTVFLIFLRCLSLSAFHGSIQRRIGLIPLLEDLLATFTKVILSFLVLWIMRSGWRFLELVPNILIRRDRSRPVSYRLLSERPFLFLKYFLLLLFFRLQVLMLLGLWREPLRNLIILQRHRWHNLRRTKIWKTIQGQPLHELHLLLIWYKFIICHFFLKLI